jgi:hypothetical protein
MSLRRIGAVVVVSCLAVAACGKAAEVVAPEIAVREAAQSTFDGHRGRFTLSLVGDAADLATLMPASEEDRRVLDVLRTSKVVIAVDGGDEADRSDDAFALDVDLGDVDHAIEVRVVDKKIYLRGDAAGLARLVEAKDGALPELVAGAQQAGLGFVADVVAGKWISIDLAPLESMAKGAVGERGGQMPELGTAQLDRILEAVSSTFGTDVDVQRLEREAAGQHYRLTVPVRRVYERLAPVIGQLFPMPGFEAPPAGEIPDRSISLDLWTEDGRVRRAELDLGQFAPQPPARRVALRVDIDELDGGIKAPGDAVEVNVMQIFGQLLGAVGATIPS